MKIVSGVDGCKAGWFAFHFDGAVWRGSVHNNIRKLYESIESELILIDIPIGLRENEKCERVCDKEARKLLTKRKPCVFPAPSRYTLECDEFAEALEINRQKTGRGLPKQAFALCPKIREVDVFIQSRDYFPEKKRIREVHPEICFWGLNGRSEMKYRKKDFLGKYERIHLLKTHLPQAKELFAEARGKHQKQDVADDDIIDALCCAVTAIYHDSLSTIPLNPKPDNKGIPMGMLYYDVFRATQPDKGESKAYCHFCGSTVGQISDRAEGRVEAVYDCPKCKVNYCSQCAWLKEDSLDGIALCLRCNSKMYRVG